MISCSIDSEKATPENSFSSSHSCSNPPNTVVSRICWANASRLRSSSVRIHLAHWLSNSSSRLWCYKPSDMSITHQQKQFDFQSKRPRTSSPKPVRLDAFGWLCLQTLCKPVTPSNKSALRSTKDPCPLPPWPSQLA